MADPRIQKLARTLVRYSIRLKRGDTVSLAAHPAARPLVAAVYEELLDKGTFPVVRLVPEELGEIFYRKAKPHHLRTLTPYAKAAARHMDASISLYGEENTRHLSSVDPKRQAVHALTHRPLVRARAKKPWLLSVFPTAAYAQEADMSLGEFEDFVYGATFSDTRDPIAHWRRLSRRQAKLIAKLRGADEIRIVGEDTDLRLSVKGRRFMNSDGSEHNMPSGEIYTGPVESSAEGHIAYDFPICRLGREISGIRLVFRKGRVVEASAEKGETYLRTMLDTDPGARRLGEIGIGTNLRIQRFVKCLLFDEKIGGTVHLALGRSIEGTGRNRSAIHWDMLKDLRKGGAILVDGKTFMKDGRFR